MSSPAAVTGTHRAPEVTIHRYQSAGVAGWSTGKMPLPLGALRRVYRTSTRSNLPDSAEYAGYSRSASRGR